MKTADYFKLFATKVDGALVAVLLLPLALLLVNENWNFTSPYIGLLDPWVHFGYFRDFPRLLHTVPNDYRASRLSWVLPGYYLHQLFPPVVANHLLHLGVYYAAIISLYLILHYTINRKTALVTSVMMGCYQPFIAAVGWDYPDGAGIAYFLLTMLMLTCAIRFARWRLFLGFAGSFYLCLIVSNLYWIPFTLPLLIYYLFINHQSRKLPIFKSILFICLGALITTAIFAILNYTHNRSFFFLMGTFQYLMNLRFSQDVSYYDRSLDWFNFPPIRPIFVVCLIGFILLMGRLGKTTTAAYRTVAFYQINLFVFLILMIALETRGWPALQYFYYANSIIPCLFLAIGAQASLLIDYLNWRQLSVILLIAASLVLALGFSFLIPANPFVLSIWQLPNQLFLLSIVVPLLLFLLVGRRHKNLLALIVLGFFTLNLSLYSISFIKGFPFTASFPKVDFGSNRNGYLAVVKSFDVLDKFVPDLKRIYREGRRVFWYNRTDQLGGVYQAIVSTHLYHVFTINEKFPELPSPNDSGFNQPFETIAPEGTKLVLFSDRPDEVLDLANKSLGAIGMGVRLLHQQAIQSGTVNFTMTFVETIKIPSR